MMMTACCENKPQETASAIDSAKIVTDVMMSRRSIRAYKDSVIKHKTFCLPICASLPKSVLYGPLIVESNTKSDA